MDLSNLGALPETPTPVTRTDAATAATGAKQNKPTEEPRKDPGPAATVDISNEARARLRQAGANSSDIAHVNLKDRSAVERAIHKARAQHAAAASGKSSTSTGTSATNATTTTTAGAPSPAKAPSKRPPATSKK